MGEWGLLGAVGRGSGVGEGWVGGGWGGEGADGVAGWWLGRWAGGCPVGLVWLVVGKITNNKNKRSLKGSYWQNP